MDPAELRRAGEVMRRAYEAWAELDAEEPMPEFDDASAPFSVELLRDAYFRAAAKEEPEFLATLAREPLDAFRHPGNPGRCPVPDPMAYLCGGSSAPLNPIEFPRSAWTLSDQARDAVAAWANRWSLTDDWCIVRALFALQLWRREPSTAGRGLIEARHLDSVSKGIPKFHGHDVQGPTGADGIRRLPWDPMRETRAAYRKRTAGRAKTRAHIDELRRRASASYGDEHDAKLVPAARKLRPGEHFVWLARYQLHATETFRSVASDCKFISPDPDPRARTVTNAIHRTAKLIGLTLRLPAHGGRPKGARNRISRD